MNLLKGLTHRHELVAIARLFSLSRFFKWVYYRVAAANDGVFRTQPCGIGACFLGRTPGEWRRFEGTYAGNGEIFLKGLISSLCPGQVFCDIGNNVGGYAVFLGKVVGSKGKVVAFEPEKDKHDHIQAHVKLSELWNVQVFQVALGEQSANMLLGARQVWG